MSLETCRYKFFNGKIITKMFGMKNGEWDIEPGWCHDKKEALAPKKKKPGRPVKVNKDVNSTRSD